MENKINFSNLPKSEKHMKYEDKLRYFDMRYDDFDRIFLNICNDFVSKNKEYPNNMLRCKNKNIFRYKCIYYFVNYYCYKNKTIWIIHLTDRGETEIKIKIIYREKEIEIIVKSGNKKRMLISEQDIRYLSYSSVKMLILRLIEEIYYLPLQ